MRMPFQLATSRNGARSGGCSARAHQLLFRVELSSRPGSFVQSLHMLMSLRRTVSHSFLVLAVSIAQAQQHRAAIRGVVVDPSFQGLANVEVRVTREETTESRRVKTDARGRFSVPELRQACTA